MSPTQPSSHQRRSVLRHAVRQKRNPAPYRVLALGLSLFLAVASIVGVLAQGLGPAGPSPAQGNASVIAQGVAQIRDVDTRWRVAAFNVEAGSEAIAVRYPAFVLGGTTPLLVTDLTAGTRQRVAPGEGAFMTPGQMIRLETFGPPDQFTLLELSPADAELSMGVLGGESGSFVPQPGIRDLDLIRTVAPAGAVSTLDAGAGPTLIRLSAGQITVTSDDATPVTLYAGQAQAFDGPLSIESGPEGATYVAAYIGAVIEFGDIGTPVATPVTEEATPSAPQPGIVLGSTPSPATPPVDAAGDPDGDGLTSAREAELGTDPSLADTDDDGINDGEEINTYNTDPLNLDTDGDLFYDGGELIRGTDPLAIDSDGDDLTDGNEEYTTGTDPVTADTDGDGIDDGQEIEDGTDPLEADTADDEEPTVEPEGEPTEEAAPEPTVEEDAGGDEGEGSLDPDGDGLVNSREAAAGTDPLDGDTDGDGVNDANEVDFGSDPLDETSFP
ncbi:MAG: hypothetical protein AVDCRST_MAG87-2132 [uncultured Thermomicrobiales bacterium]|uniref:FecR protein domain-containing protein n=1 Tax=uncultured Thermomicrobiales bacterium TaxID=1645740 RepID=A0A6J4V5W3_9BACT|nr:MAG: hypothetical protein AVDCRST_MAG87-2132 [uncultured Thermomicrobiales bacterium]